MLTLNHVRHNPLWIVKTVFAVVLLWGLSTGILYAVSQYNYLLFHSLAELFSIVVGTTVFMLAWNTRRFIGNDFLVVVGFSYLFVGLLDLIHTLAYKGMAVFPGNDANLPTQLWIAARYLQSLSFLLAAALLKRRISPRWVLIGFSTVTVLLIASIVTGLFPDCYVNGLTSFKKVSEFVIASILLITLLWLRHNREAFHPRILNLITVAFVCMILTELAFTSYVSVFGPSNFLGHILKIIATYYIYKSIIEIGLNQPFDLLFRDMKIREEELENSRKLLQELATHDPLTGLPNRLVFEARLTHALEKSQRKNYPVGNCMVQVMMMDVDNFKNINDLLGHIGGDEALIEIARCLQGAMRESDTISRWGGDEFAFVLEDVSSVQDADQLAQKILTSVSKPMLIRGLFVNPTVSLGISLSPRHGTSKEDLIRCADAALYRAKETKQSFRIYDDSMQNPLLHRYFVDTKPFGEQPDHSLVAGKEKRK